MSSNIGSCVRFTGVLVLETVKIAANLVALAATVAIVASLIGCPIAAIAGFSLKARIIVLIGASLLSILVKEELNYLGSSKASASNASA